jgi:Hydantoinase/oxoprolinase N-terminal region
VQVGADTGGTFTDLVSADGRSTKVLSTPADPGRAVAVGLGELAARDRGLDLATGEGAAGEGPAGRPWPPTPCSNAGAPQWRW